MEISVYKESGTYPSKVRKTEALLNNLILKYCLRNSGQHFKLRECYKNVFKPHENFFCFHFHDSLSSSATRLFPGWVPRLTSDNFKYRHTETEQGEKNKLFNINIFVERYQDLPSSYHFDLFL